MTTPDRHVPILPGGSRARHPVPAPFKLGGLVQLKASPHGEPGTVEGWRRGHLIVRWAALNFIGRHRPQTLLLAEDDADAKEKETP